MTREQFMDMDDWELINVWFRPNRNKDKPEKGYWPVTREDSKDKTVGLTSYQKLFFEARRRRGQTEEEIEAEFKRLNPKWTHG